MLMGALRHQQLPALGPPPPPPHQSPNHAKCKSCAAFLHPEQQVLPANVFTTGVVFRVDSIKTAAAVAPKVEEPVKDDPPPVSVTVKDPFEEVEPGGTKLATPLPVRIPKCFQAVSTEPEPQDSDTSGPVDAPLVEVGPASAAPLPPTPAAPAPLSPALLSPALLSPAPLSPAPLSPAPVSAVTEFPGWTQPEAERAPKPSQRQRSDFHSTNSCNSISDGK